MTSTTFFFPCSATIACIYKAMGICWKLPGDRFSYCEVLSFFILVTYFWIQAFFDWNVCQSKWIFFLANWQSTTNLRRTRANELIEGWEFGTARSQVRLTVKNCKKRLKIRQKTPSNASNEEKNFDDRKASLEWVFSFHPLLFKIDGAFVHISSAALCFVIIFCIFHSGVHNQRWYLFACLY